VAVSINLERIVALRSLPGAALGSIVLLVAVLMVSTLALVPEQPRWVLGGEVLVVGMVAWSILTVIWIRALRAPIPDQPRFVPVLSVVVTQAATIPMVIAGVSLLLRAGGGLYWLVPRDGLLAGGRRGQRLGPAGRGGPLTRSAAPASCSWRLAASGRLQPAGRSDGCWP
jgi:hypothetical protein